MPPAGFLSMFIIATLLKGRYSEIDPCSSQCHSIKEGYYKRSSNYTIQSTDIAISDNFLSEGWYRFDSLAGNDMVTWAPSIYQCGTIYPMWMNGTLPTESDGEVNRTVCIVGFYESCSKTLTIKVKACREYRVYYLVPAPQTSTGYCIGEHSHCPPGQSSDSGFTPCVDVIPVNTSPAVNVSLENKLSNNARLKPVEPVFKCLFDEPDAGPYWYDTYWYINTDLVKVVESQPYQSNQSWLYPKDWVDTYNLNMVVKCSIRVRHLERSTPGHHNYSENFKAGMFPSSYVYGLKEGETISIKFSVTVPVGCLDVKRQYLCKTNIYILTPEYKPSTPSSSCQNFSGQGDVFFDENGCGIVIESSTWWEEKVLNVTGNTDGLINMKDRDMYIKLGSLRDGAEDISGVWYNFSMPNIQISISDEDRNMVYKVCGLNTDPRMITFDRLSWTAYLPGEFILYRDKRRKISVHVLFSNCLQSPNSVPCACGIAVRVENSLFSYRSCEKISNRYTKPMIHHEIVYQKCDDSQMEIELRKPWDTMNRIILPTGAVVWFSFGDNDWMNNLDVYPSVFDEDNVDGMCGNPNYNLDDDFIDINGTVFSVFSSIVDPEKCNANQAVWRVSMNSTESLFGAKVSLDVNDFEMKKYCDCSTETQLDENSIANHYTANCSITTQAVRCSSKYKSQKLTSACTYNQNRFKRDANIDTVGLINRSEDSDDSDDVIESQPLYYDPDFDPNPVFTLSWKNGWTETAARGYCENITLNNPARVGCRKYIAMDNFTDVAIRECVLDIRDSGTTDFARYTLQSLNHFCFEQIKKYEIFHIKNDFEEESVVETIGKLVCPNDCSSNGVCNGGVCQCRSLYIGEDCSHPISAPPANLSLPRNGLCETSKRACAKTNIFGHFRSETVYAKLEKFEITNFGRLTVLSNYTTQATYINPTIVRINFPTNSRSSSENTWGSGFNISVSYDATHFGDSLVIIIYNDVCYSCNASTLECTNTSACQDVSQIPKVTQNPKKPNTDGETLGVLTRRNCDICPIIHRFSATIR
ncbi:von Willebrand factor D and EGF domain-containing protein isoform X2 [Magallana gigas]|uniref:von Willebrand factor D and EGF domain-containing protein isoform X2 n=1 Tax=Magallana gigas TaxID=29159 RepID=UPI00333E3EF4